MGEVAGVSTGVLPTRSQPAPTSIAEVIAVPAGFTMESATEQGRDGEVRLGSLISADGRCRTMSRTWQNRHSLIRREQVRLTDRSPPIWQLCSSSSLVIGRGAKFLALTGMSLTAQLWRGTRCPERLMDLANNELGLEIGGVLRCRNLRSSERLRRVRVVRYSLHHFGRNRLEPGTRRSNRGLIDAPCH